MNKVYFGCNICKSVSKASDWNKATLAIIDKPNLLKMYKKIENAGIQNRWYICPKCKAVCYNKDIVGCMKTEVEK